MPRQVYRIPRRFLCNGPALVLALFFLGGLLIGVWAAALAGDSFFLMMRAAALSRVSILGLLAVLFLPFLLSAVAVLCSQPKILFFLAFAKAFSFAASAFGIGYAFGSAGWLVRLFLIFSDGCILPVLFWFWLGHCDGRKEGLLQDAARYLLAAGAVGIMDFCVISPFLAFLMDK